MMLIVGIEVLVGEPFPMPLCSTNLTWNVRGQLGRSR